MKGNSLCLVFMCNWFSIFAISYIILFKTNCRGFLTQTLVWLIDIWATIKNLHVKSILEKNRYRYVPIRQVISTTVIFSSYGLFGKKLSIEIQDLTIIHILVLVNMFELYSISAEKSDFFFNRDTLLYTQGAKNGKILRCLF